MNLRDLPILIQIPTKGNDLFIEFSHYGLLPLVFQITTFICNLDGKNESANQDVAITRLKKIAIETNDTLYVNAVINGEITNAKNESYLVLVVKSLFFYCTTEQLDSESDWERKIRMQAVEATEIQNLLDTSTECQLPA